MTEPTTHMLEAPGAVLAYDIRRSDNTTDPPLFLTGWPMGAAGYGTLSGYFPDRTLVTYDPRGSERSKRTPDAPPNSPEVHAEDLHRIIEALGCPVDMFGSSGGAINAFALITKYPQDLRLLIAHEPPAFAVLPDREAIFAAVDDMQQTYQKSGFGPALAKFIPLSSQHGPIPADWAARPAPDPQMFGLPTEDDGSRDDPLFAHGIVHASHFEPDFEALRASGVQIVMAAGEESAEQMTSRATHVIADRLGLDVVVFPGGHGGFMGGEYGQPAGKPQEFAAKLREVLESAAVPAPA